MSSADHSSPKSAFSNDIVEKFYHDMPNDNKLMVDFYDHTSPDIYDEFMGSVNYTEPDEIIKQTFALSLPHSAKILDVGAGTGLIGESLYKNGYDNLHASDPSKTQLTKLEAKKIYKSSEVVLLGYGNFPTEETKEQYDLVTAAGVFWKGHMPREGMEEIHGYLKPGGYFITAMRDFYYTEGESEMRYYSQINKMLDEKQFELVKKYTFKRGLSNEANTSNNPLFNEFTSICFVFRKTGYE
jgi:predicted TPR repeat methyltransferase